MKRCIPLLATLCLLAACDKSPDQARKDLEKRGVAVSGKALIKETKREDGRTARDLVLAGADPHAKTRGGMSALMSAAYNGQVDTVRLLIEKGADVNAMAGGFTVLGAAVFSGKPDIVQMLIRAGADPNRAGRGGQTPLAAAQAAKNEAIVQLLRGAGAKG